MAVKSDNAGGKIDFTIVVLTYNRREVLADLLQQLEGLQSPGVEVVVVDNGSSDGSVDFVRSRHPSFRLVPLAENLGAVGRNRGMKVARGRYVVTIDDDILGLDTAALQHLAALFDRNLNLGAVCFKVVDYYSGNVCNWCHPKKPETHSDSSFETNEITEGAVAFRNVALQHVGLYPEEFFISHEGTDLVARMVDAGYEVHYAPQVTVLHKYARNARPGWRRYYYDTRNDFWLALRNFRLPFVMLHLLRRLPVTFIYAARDGFLPYWFRAVRDALAGFPGIMRQRRPISWSAHIKLHRLNHDKPGVVYYLKRRLFARQVRI